MMNSVVDIFRFYCFQFQAFRLFLAGIYVYRSSHSAGLQFIPHDPEQEKSFKFTL